MRRTVFGLTFIYMKTWTTWKRNIAFKDKVKVLDSRRYGKIKIHYIFISFKKQLVLNFEVRKNENTHDNCWFSMYQIFLAIHGLVPSSLHFWLADLQIRSRKLLLMSIMESYMVNIKETGTFLGVKASNYCARVI